MRHSRFLLPIVLGSLATAQSGSDGSLARMQEDLRYLCSEKLAGRASLSPGADLAAHYIAQSFEKAGLSSSTSDHGFLQSFALLAATPGRPATRLALVRNGSRTELRADEFRGTAWATVNVTAPVVFAGYGITAPEYGYDDYAGIDTSGKIILIFDHEPQETDAHSRFNGTGHTRYASSSRVKMEIARRHGAVALLVVSEPLRKHAGTFDVAPRPPTSAGVAVVTPSLRATAPRQTLDDGAIPVIQINDRVAAELLRATGRTPSDLQSAIDRDLQPASQLLPDTRLEISSAPVEPRRGESANVVGLLEGSDPVLRGETILITAHYDHLGLQNGHLYPGANDNASGSVAVMELARLFSRDPARPKRSLLFVVFGSEEERLLGSYYYVAHPLRPLATTRAVLNLDMIARDEAHIPQSQGVVEIPADTHNQINLVGAFYSRELEAVIREADAKVGLDITTKFDRDHDLNVLFRCDHFPFLLHDVPAVWLFGGFHPGYHEPSDTMDRLDYPKLEKVVRLTYESARLLSGASSTPRFTPR
jgi:hypothetical protein